MMAPGVVAAESNLRTNVTGMKEQIITVIDSVIDGLPKSNEQPQPIAEEPQPVVEEPQPIAEEPQPITDEPQLIADEPQQPVGEEDKEEEKKEETPLEANTLPPVKEETPFEDLA